MKTTTVHVYSDIILIIDEYVKKKEYSTRADFVLHAMRHTMNVYAQKKKLMVEQFIKDGQIHASEIDDLYSSITQTYMLAYEGFSGDTVQINIRIPEGLESKLGLLIKNRYGFDRKSDYTKVSIICLITELNECECIFQDTESLVNDEQALLEKVYSNMIQGLIHKKSGKTILNDAYNMLNEKK